MPAAPPAIEGGRTRAIRGSPGRPATRHSEERDDEGACQGLSRWRVRSNRHDGAAGRRRDSPRAHCKKKSRGHDSIIRTGPASESQGEAHPDAAAALPRNGLHYRKIKLISPHTGIRPAGSASITSSFRRASIPNSTSQSGSPGEIGPIVRPFNTMDRMPGARRSRRTTGPPPNRGGRWNHRVSRTRPAGRSSTRTGKASRADTDSESPGTAHSQPPRRRISWVPTLPAPRRKPHVRRWNLDG